MTQSTERPVAGSLRDKLVRASVLQLTLVGLFTIVVVVLLSFRTAEKYQANLEASIRDTLDVRGESLVQSHVGIFQSFVADHAFSEMQRTVAVATGRDDIVYGSFVSSNGRTYAHCSPTSQCSEDVSPIKVSVPSLHRVQSELKLDTESLHSVKPHSRDRILFGLHIVEFSRPVFIDGELVGTLRYGISTAANDETLRRTREDHDDALMTSLASIVLVFAMTLMVGIAISRRTAQSVVRPVAELMGASRDLAAGKRDARVVIKSGDELERLGDAFNTMADDLVESYTALESRNRTLAVEIEDRKRAQAERGEMQAHLMQSQKMEAFGQVAGGVAHDFNNILAVVIGNSELVEMLLKEDQLQEALELNQQVAQAAERGANLTRQLLTFARKEVNNPQVVDINATITGFEKLIRRVIEESIEVVVSTTSPLPQVLIDPGRLEQVIMNLCVNARDAMPTGGQLLLSTRREQLSEDRRVVSGTVSPGEYVTLTVSDQGTGISDDVLKRVFEPFFTTKTAGKGTGLGLATVHGIIEDAQGHIDIHSVVGKGTTFVVYLPVSLGEESKQKLVSIRPLPAGDGQRVLLCEDEPPVRALAYRILEMAGFAVTPVASGAEAMECLKHQSFDLLLTDAVMPGMHGGELALAAREIRPEMPVLFVSGYKGGTLESVGITEESANFLRKPFRSHELVEHVVTTISQRLGVTITESS